MPNMLLRSNFLSILISLLSFTISQSIIQVKSLHRYAVKGLSDDKFTEVYIDKGLPNDRKYALIKSSKRSLFSSDSPEWLHKDNFICAFTRNELMSRFESHFEDQSSELTVWRRIYKDDGTFSSTLTRSTDPVLDSINLECMEGRRIVSDFFSSECGEMVNLISASNHQFGNTRAGIKDRNDTRTCHIINAATVREISEKIGFRLNEQRFRPNIVVDGIAPWAEFDELLGKNLVVTQHPIAKRDTESPLVLKVCSRTVRCDGVSIDPYDQNLNIDIPSILNKHYPNYGPYLGVYAVIENPGMLSVDDFLKIQS